MEEVKKQSVYNVDGKFSYHLYSEANKEKIHEKNEKYRELNKETLKEKNRIYYEKNKATVNAKRRAKYAEKKACSENDAY
jgi:hypothetical protein